MIKVMIVDDEPYIRQGLKILINWEEHGYIVCEEAANGIEAINRMKETDIDLVITDIRMPGMDGLELIEYTREHISKKIRFIILSGFYEFEYAKKAIKNDVADYVLKPVQREELLKVLEDYKEFFHRQMENFKKQEHSERIIFDSHLENLVFGTHDKECINLVKRYLIDIINVRYIRIEYDFTDDEYNNLHSKEKAKEQSKLYYALNTHLGVNGYHTYIPQKDNSDFFVGFIYAKKLTEKENISEKEYIKNLHDTLKATLSY
ncbi:MAG: response regulator, partial [Anaerolineaceae bacterium]